MAEERLQKLIARSGLCSRREADKRIKEGRVTVNGKVAKLGSSADPLRDHIKVDGKLIRAPQPFTYVLLYKPKEVMTTCNDPEERTTVVDLVRSRFKTRVFPIGRLDYHSEGLILLTNDGDLAAQVSHPRYGIEREYLVKVKGDLSQEEIGRLKKGTVVDRRHVRPKAVQRERATADRRNTWWRIVVTEGRTHEVRELFFRVGHRVQRLRRTAIGPIRDTRLRPGDFRELEASELEALRTACKRSGAAGKNTTSRRDRGPRPEKRRRDRK
jgi:23S rRNA pseudouridine2605 synthase